MLIFFEAHDTILLGISVDNIPTLFAWTHEMGSLWFDVLADFWPMVKLQKPMGFCDPMVPQKGH